MNLMLKEAVIYTLAVVACIMLAVFLCTSQGCVTVKAKPSPEIKELLFEEAGFNLAYYTMWQESGPAIERADAIIRGGVDMLGTKAVPEMVFLMTEYIRDAPQFKAHLERYAPLITTTMRLLDGLLDIDLDVPEKNKDAVECLRAFFGGALDGIMEIRKMRMGKEEG